MGLLNNYPVRTTITSGDRGLGSDDGTTVLFTPDAYGAYVAGRLGVYNVLDYGAVGDGVTDDTAAIHAAISAAGAAGGGVVWLVGTFLVTGLTVSSNNVHIRGAGRHATTIKSHASIGSNPVLTIDGQYCSVRSLTLNGNSLGASLLYLKRSRFVADDLYCMNSATHGIRVAGTAGNTAHAGQFTNIYVIACAGNGVFLDAYAYDTEFTNLWVGQCGVGVRAQDGALFFENLHVWGCTGNGVEVRANASRFSNVYLESNGGRGIDIFNCSNISVIGGVLWKNGGAGATCNTANRNRFVGLGVYDNTGAGISINPGNYNQITGCNFFDDQGTKTQTYGVSLGAGSTSNIVANAVARAGDHLTGSILDSGTTSVLTGNVTA